MGKIHKPVKGSRAFWPKKRAARMFSRFDSHEYAHGAGILDFAGYKAGMTQVSVLDGRKTSTTAGLAITKAVTVLQVPKLHVIGVRVYVRTDALRAAGEAWAEHLPKGLERAVSTPKKPDTAGQMAALEKMDKAEVRLLCCTNPIWKQTPEVFELSLGGTAEQQWALAKERLGKELAATEVFKEGDWVDAKAVTVGKGTAGVVQRFGLRIRSRKNKKKMRHIGNIGTRGVGRVLPGTIAMAGQLGFQTRTEFNKRILKVGAGGLTPAGGWLDFGELKGDYLMLSGSVPGPKKRLVFLRKGIRTHHVHTEPEQLLDVYLYSQQGK